MASTAANLTLLADSVAAQPVFARAWKRDASFEGLAALRAAMKAASIYGLRPPYLIIPHYAKGLFHQQWSSTCLRDIVGRRRQRLLGYGCAPAMH